jgi:hypothetical protein
VGKSQSQFVAQYELLRALVRLFPEPLIDLRDRVGRGTHSSDLVAIIEDGADAKTPRSPSRARVLEAKERLRALSPEKRHALDLAESLEHPQPSAPLGDALSAWANRWHLHALLDLAPGIYRYWVKRPAAANRFHFPTLRPILPSPRINQQVEPHDTSQPVLADPDYESENEFVERARHHYQVRAKTLTITPHHRRRKLRQHAEWYVRGHVQGWTDSQIADAVTTERNAPDVSTITKAIHAFSVLLSAPPTPPPRL